MITKFLLVLPILAYSRKWDFVRFDFTDMFKVRFRCDRKMHSSWNHRCSRPTLIYNAIWPSGHWTTGFTGFNFYIILWGNTLLYVEIGLRGSILTKGRLIWRNFSYTQSNAFGWFICKYFSFPGKFPICNVSTYLSCVAGLKSKAMHNKNEYCKLNKWQCNKRKHISSSVTLHRLTHWGRDKMAVICS